ncbi:hypothetical protein POVWA2_023340 [Plasmodium ovale wallikeri]|uniref:Uncharacterized protein n=1 Tax=Plasmodium ovale wallikeri TaxID=864142 RepID=A0A1A8YT36_PLAOA|nr:hypothetical protein POVWA1_023540 [Plasmodium ovale wallikeri]SBT35117.1 hypothetical protein POVWA2_023340 [Plasmodium ovale wallikeri]
MVKKKGDKSNGKGKKRNKWRHRKNCKSAQIGKLKRMQWTCIWGGGVAPRGVTCPTGNEKWGRGGKGVNMRKIPQFFQTFFSTRR